MIARSAPLIHVHNVRVDEQRDYVPETYVPSINLSFVSRVISAKIADHVPDSL